jgi:hypothetical protein
LIISLDGNRIGMNLGEKMKKLVLFMLLAFSAFTLFAEDSKATKSELPSFTYYYFDG